MVTYKGKPHCVKPSEAIALNRSDLRHLATRNSTQERRPYECSATFWIISSSTSIANRTIAKRHYADPSSSLQKRHTNLEDQSEQPPSNITGLAPRISTSPRALNNAVIRALV